MFCGGELKFATDMHVISVTNPIQNGQFRTKTVMKYHFQMNRARPLSEMRSSCIPKVV